jgi:DNA replication protein DnaC
MPLRNLIRRAKCILHERFDTRIQRGDIAELRCGNWARGILWLRALAVCAVLLGPTGTGKTHLLTALGYTICANGNYR